MNTAAIRGLGMCLNCNAELPPGRRLCSMHYQQALAQYEMGVAEYERELAEWNETTDEERNHAHSQAEGHAMTSYAGAFGALAGGALWLFLRTTRHLDGLYGVSILVGCIVVCTVVPPLRRILGRLTRTMTMGLLYAAVLAAVTFGISKISDVVAAHAPGFYIGAVAAGFVGSIFREVSGGHHASAAPVRPIPPSP